MSYKLICKLLENTEKGTAQGDVKVPDTKTIGKTNHSLSIKTPKDNVMKLKLSDDGCSGCEVVQSFKDVEDHNKQDTLHKVIEKPN